MLERSCHILAFGKRRHLFIIGLIISAFYGWYWGGALKNEFSYSLLTYFSPYDDVIYFGDKQCYLEFYTNPNVRGVFKLIDSPGFFYGFMSEYNLDVLFFAGKEKIGRYELDNRKYDPIAKKWLIEKPKNIDSFRYFRSKLNIKEQERYGFIIFSFTFFDSDYSKKVLKDFINYINNHYYNEIKKDLKKKELIYEDIIKKEKNIAQKSEAISEYFDVKSCLARLKGKKDFPFLVVDQYLKGSLLDFRGKMFYFFYSVIFYLVFYVLIINIFEVLIEINKEDD